LRWAASAFRQVGMGQRWAYQDQLAGRWYGPAAALIAEQPTFADVVINVAADPLPSPLAQVPVRIFVDCDPLFQQLRMLAEPVGGDAVREPSAFFPFGENIRQPGCGIPDDEILWRPTRQPVVLSWWRCTERRDSRAPFTSVLQWDSYASRSHAGVDYGMK